MVDLLYPRRCPVCHDIVSDKGELACRACQGIFELVVEPRCKRCSKQVDSPGDEYCYDCSGKEFSFDGGYALWKYKKELKQSMYAYKYNGRREYADYYAQQILRYYKDSILSWEPDALVPIPLGKARRRKRGYNQAEEIAKRIASEIGLPVDNRILIRQRDTLPQKQLSDKERIKNLERAFKIQGNSVEYKNIVLVDDIYTTGSTMNACARILKRSGALKIYYISVCIGKGY